MTSFSVIRPNQTSSSLRPKCSTKGNKGGSRVDYAATMARGAIPPWRSGSYQTSVIR